MNAVHQSDLRKVFPGSNKHCLHFREFLLATYVILLFAITTILFQIINVLKVRPVEPFKKNGRQLIKNIGTA